MKNMHGTWPPQKHFFRNENHAIWFWVSSGALVFTVIMSTAPRPDATLATILLCIHALVGVKAIVVTVHRTPSEHFSHDCIWFNGLLACTYAALCWCT